MVKNHQFFLVQYAEGIAFLQCPSATDKGKIGYVNLRYGGFSVLKNRQKKTQNRLILPVEKHKSFYRQILKN